MNPEQLKIALDQPAQPVGPATVPAKSHHLSSREDRGNLVESSSSSLSSVQLPPSSQRKGSNMSRNNRPQNAPSHPLHPHHNFGGTHGGGGGVQLPLHPLLAYRSTHLSPPEGPPPPGLRAPPPPPASQMMLNPHSMMYGSLPTQQPHQILGPMIAPSHDSMPARTVRRFLQNFHPPLLQTVGGPQFSEGMWSSPVIMNHPPRYTWEGPLREGEHELLCDFDEAPMTVDSYGNISSMVYIVTPRVAPEFTLLRLWSAYNQPNGFEVPMNGALIAWLRPDEPLYYIPVLSGFHFQELHGGQRHFEHYVKEPPHDRLPLPQYVQWLTANNPTLAELMEKKGEEMTHDSWYCVLWLPIHCQNHISTRSAGTFLTYHYVNPLLKNPQSPVYQGTPFRPPGAETSALELQQESIYGKPYYCSLFALLPYKVKADVWYRWMGRGMYRAPLALVKHVNLLSLHEERRMEGPWQSHHDLEHFIKYDRSLANFLGVSLR